MTLRNDYLPDSDDGLLAFALNMSNYLTANYAALGLPQATANTFSSKYNTFKATLAAAQQPATRGNATVLQKNQARKDLVGFTRLVARTVGNNMAVSDNQRQALGLRIRKTHPTPQPAPTARPGVTVKGVSMRTVTIGIFDPASASKRAKLPGAIGAKVYTFIGSEYPSDPSLWAYNGDATRNQYEITFDPGVAAGTQVWACCAWYNRKGETGPVSVPVSTNLQGGGAVQQQAELKIAA